MITPDGSTRFDLLETLREFGQQQLEANGEADGVARHHCAYFADLAERAGLELRGDAQPEWLARLDREHANIRAALDLALERGDGATALRLVRGSAEYWYARGLVREGTRRLEQVLAVADDAPLSLRAEGYMWHGQFARDRADFAVAEASLLQAIELARQARDNALRADALLTLSITLTYQGRWHEASEFNKQGLAAARLSEDWFVVADCLTEMSRGLAATGEYAQACAVAEESLAIWRELGERIRISQVLTFLGWYALWQGDLERAARLGGESLSVAREIDDNWCIGFISQLLGCIALEQCQYTEAGTWLRVRVNPCRPARHADAGRRGTRRACGSCRECWSCRPRSDPPGNGRRDPRASQPAPPSATPPNGGAHRGSAPYASDRRPVRVGLAGWPVDVARRGCGAGARVRR